ncbi:MAG: OmpA family protein [Pseudomonadota bacterium]
MASTALAAQADDAVVEADNSVVETSSTSKSAAETGSSYNNYVNFGAFYLDADKGRAEDGTSVGYNAGFGHRLNTNLWVEGQFFGDTIETGITGTDNYQTGGGVDFHYAFGQRSEFTPFLIVGGGGVYNDVAGSNNDELTPYLNVGLGFTKSIFGFDNLRLRGEVRAVYDDYKEGQTDIRVGLGLEMALGSAPVKEPEVIIREVPVEKIVIQEVPVERIVIKEVPAPAPEVVPPAPVSVDDDGDGVINERDKCPNTLKGARVDGNGCVVEQTLTIRDITFDNNSARLTANAQRLMENVVSFLRSDPSTRISISGHTDSVASDAYNMKLSRSRAIEVRDYLVGYGIDAARLDATGYGESRPVASNDSAEGRELNRRVEFRIQK